MGCPGFVVIGQNLVFTVDTHDPDTGVVTDADSAPAYRIYEEDTAVPILSGTMTLFDDVNTTGFYLAKVAATAGNGFENGKCYIVRIQATVDGDPGAISYGVLAITDIDDAVWAHSPRTLTQTAAEVAAVLEGTDLTIHRGDSLSISITGLGVLTGYTSIWFTLKTRKDLADSAATIQIDTATGLLYLNGAAAGTPANGAIAVDDAVAGDITITLEEIETAKLARGRNLYWDVQMLNAGTVTTLTEGKCDITRDVTVAIS